MMIALLNTIKFDLFLKWWPDRTIAEDAAMRYSEEMRLIVNILIWSLLVGLLLAWLRIDPVDLLRDGLHLLAALPRMLADMLGWAWPYVATGAVIVVPIALIGLLPRLWRRSRRDDRA